MCSDVRKCTVIGRNEYKCATKATTAVINASGSVVKIKSPFKGVGISIGRSNILNGYKVIAF